MRCNIFDLLSQQEGLRFSKRVTQQYDGYTGVFFYFESDSMPNPIAFDGTSDAISPQLHQPGKIVKIRQPGGFRSSLY